MITNNEKTDKAFAKWDALNDAADNEFQLRKADAAFRALEKMFDSKEEFKSFWDSKMNYKITLAPRNNYPPPERH